MDVIVMSEATKVWATVADIATVFTAIVTFVAAIFVVLQLRAAQRAVHAQAYTLVIEHVQNEEVRQARKIVFSLQEKSLEKWNEDELNDAERVCHTYDAVGQMVRNSFLSKRIIIDSWGASLERIWPILKPLVHKKRIEYNASEYWDDIEWLAIQAGKRKL